MQLAPGVLAVVICLAGCSREPFDAQTEGAKLLQRDAEWANVASAGRDIDMTVSYWSDDALLVPEGQPVAEGKAAIRAVIRGMIVVCIACLGLSALIYGRLL
mgnify:CR=1 FL=1